MSVAVAWVIQMSGREVTPAAADAGQEDDWVVSFFKKKHNHKELSGGGGGEPRPTVPLHQ
jgi:hypothetical protein